MDCFSWVACYWRLISNSCRVILIDSEPGYVYYSALQEPSLLLQEPGNLAATQMSSCLLCLHFGFVFKLKVAGLVCCCCFFLIPFWLLLRWSEFSLQFSWLVFISSKWQLFQLQAADFVSVTSLFVSSSVKWGKYCFLGWCVDAQSLSRVWFFATSWTVTCQAPLSMRFPR